MTWTDKRHADGSVTRTFKHSTAEHELKWHQDGETRTIVPIKPNNWMLQLDNQEPEPLDCEKVIPKHVWHRIIKGTGDLHVIIRGHGD